MGTLVVLGRFRWLLAAFAAAAGGGALAQSSEVAAGRQKAAQLCVACHGALGLATAPDAPHLAGQSAIYTAAQMRAYRSGARRHEVMAVIARQLSDEEIAQRAAWYASLKVEVTAPP
jgi:cytochrome c553